MHRLVWHRKASVGTTVSIAKLTESAGTSEPSERTEHRVGSSKAIDVRLSALRQTRSIRPGLGGTGNEWTSTIKPPTPRPAGTPTVRFPGLAHPRQGRSQTRIHEALRSRRPLVRHWPLRWQGVGTFDIADAGVACGFGLGPGWEVLQGADYEGHGATGLCVIANPLQITQTSFLATMERCRGRIARPARTRVDLLQPRGLRCRACSAGAVSSSCRSGISPQGEARGSPRADARATRPNFASLWLSRSSSVTVRPGLIGSPPVQSTNAGSRARLCDPIPRDHGRRASAESRGASCSLN
jgi:hypothetical protein